MVNYVDVNSAAAMAGGRGDAVGLAQQLKIIGYLLVEIRDALTDTPGPDAPTPPPDPDV